MSNKRMFNISVVNSDAFFDLPLPAQALYFHMAMRADDDGFVENPRTIRRMAGAEQSDYDALASAGYVIPFESGVVAITHWNIHNTIQGDRKKTTVYQKELRQLKIVDGLYQLRGEDDPDPEEPAAESPADAAENGAEAGCTQSGNSPETDCKQSGNGLLPNCIQTGNKLETECKQTGSNPEQDASKVVPQNRLDKISIDKGSIEQVSLAEFSSFSDPGQSSTAEGRERTRAPARGEAQASSAKDNKAQGRTGQGRTAQLTQINQEQAMEQARLPAEARERVRRFNKQIEAIANARNGGST